MCSELLAKPVIESVGRAGLTCENAMKTALEGVDAPKVEVRKVTVNGNRASATVHTTASNQPASDDTTERKRPRRAPPGRSGASVVDCLARSHPSDHSSG